MPGSRRGTATVHHRNLIAAVPDLLVALRPFAEWKLYDSDNDSTPLAVRGVETRITAGDVRRARAAIAKATGQEVP